MKSPLFCRGLAVCRHTHAVIECGRYQTNRDGVIHLVIVNVRQPLQQWRQPEYHRVRCQFVYSVRDVFDMLAGCRFVCCITNRLSQRQRRRACMRAYVHACVLLLWSRLVNWHLLIFYTEHGNLKVCVSMAYVDSRVRYCVQSRSVRQLRAI